MPRNVWLVTRRCSASRADARDNGTTRGLREGEAPEVRAAASRRAKRIQAQLVWRDAPSAACAAWEKVVGSAEPPQVQAARPPLGPPEPPLRAGRSVRQKRHGGRRDECPA